MRILVTGGTGFIGRALVAALQRGGHTVSVLSRRPAAARRILGDAVTVADTFDQLLRNSAPDAVVNLAGESIADRPWTARRRQLVRASRIDLTCSLIDALERHKVALSVLINASAIGWYGVCHSDDVLDERAAVGRGFAAELCADWERAAASAARLGTIVSILRIGLVLGREGGVLPPLALATRFGAGCVLGDGRQWMSWIHRDDVVMMIMHLLAHRESGVWNAVAPVPVRQREFADLLARRLNRPRWLRIPGVMLSAALGELADELLLSGARVLPQRFLAAGVQPRFAELDDAFSDLL